MTETANPLIAARDAFAAEHPEERVAIGGRTWGVIDTGAGPGNKPALLLLPGTLGRADIFWQQIAALTEIRSLAVSYPASGGLVAWAADLDALLEARGLDRVAVLGSSLGGYMAQHFAATRSDRITHLFAANTLASVQGVAKRPPYSLDLWAAPIADLREGFAAAMRAQITRRPIERQMVELLLTESAGRIPEAELRARLDALKTAPDLPGVTGSPDAATVIDSADDPILPDHIRQGVRDRLAPAPGFRFAWGGHFPYVLRPELYTALIRARLRLAALPADWKSGEA